MRRTLLAILGLTLAACGGRDDASAPETPETDTTATPEHLTLIEPTPDPAPPEAPPMLVGEFCFFKADENTDEGLRVVFDGTTGSGAHFGVIHQEEEAYYAAFDTQLSNGQILADGAYKFTTVTEVDGDTQHDEEVWRITPQLAHLSDLEEEAYVLESASCTGLEDQVYGEPVE